LTLIKSISGIRGIVNDGFDYNTLQEFALAFLQIQKPGPILIARDGRSHGLALSEKLSKFLYSINKTVINCGIIPTPTAQFIVEKNKYSGGIIITASHNPDNWNGIKFIDSDGCFINPEKYKKLLETVEKKEVKTLEFNNSGAIIDYNNNALNSHLDNIINLSSINLDRIKKKKYQIVVDAINCSTSKIIPMLLEKLSCDVISINCKSDGDFSRGAEPLPHNLSTLSKTVIDTKSDLGIATDPDGDRLAVVDEKGNPIGEESTLVICCDSLLMNNQIKSPIVVNLSTSMAIDNLAKKNNIPVLRSQVGEINVVNEMKRVKSEIGGEGNGGVILPESHYGRDSLVATILLLNRLSMENITMSQLHNNIPHYEIIKDFIKTDKAIDHNFIKLIKKELNPIEINEVDGIKLIWPNKWLHIRKSNTEPIVRFYSEAEKTTDSLELISKSKKIFNN